MQSFNEIKNLLTHAAEQKLNCWLVEKCSVGRILVVDARKTDENTQVLISSFQGKVWINLTSTDKIIIK